MRAIVDTVQNAEWMMLSVVNVFITFRLGKRLILCFKSRPLDISVSNQVKQHDVTR